MPELFDNFDTVFPDGEGKGRNTPLERRVSLRDRVLFLLANQVIMPVVCLIYTSVSVKCLCGLLPVFKTRLYPFRWR